MGPSRVARAALAFIRLAQLAACLQAVAKEEIEEEELPAKEADADKTSSKLEEARSSKQTFCIHILIVLGQDHGLAELLNALRSCWQ